LLVIALVALRLGVGWQFFQEGRDKVTNGFDAKGFLSSAKGPLAPMYKGMLNDPDGLKRFNRTHEDVREETGAEYDLDKTLEEWDLYRHQATLHYRWQDEEQELEAIAVYENFAEQLEWFFATNHDDIVDYFNGYDRIERMKNEPMRYEVASLAGQRDTIISDWRKLGGPLLSQIDEMWANYQQEINLVATAEQRKKYGEISLDPPGADGVVSVGFVNKLIPWMDVIVGVLLILGLFTRPASIVGAAFLFSVVLSQWPGARDAAPTIYQINLLLALLVLAASGAGRFMGLDALFGYAWKRFRPARQGAQANES